MGPCLSPRCAGEGFVVSWLAFIASAAGAPTIQVVLDNGAVNAPWFAERGVARRPPVVAEVLSRVAEVAGRSVG